MKKRAPLDGRAQWLSAFTPGVTPQALYKRLVELFYNRPQMQDMKKSYLQNYNDGPMIWLGGQIVKRMERAGWPAKIYCGYRSPEEQNRLHSKRINGKRVTNAKAFESPHQFFEAVDIVHKSLYWDAPPEFWETLASVVRVVGREYGVELNHGHYWRMVDSAHIEIKDWRSVRARLAAKPGPMRPPSPPELVQRFYEVLPEVISKKRGQ